MKHRLLDHPFYQAWREGMVAPQRLADYHDSYAELIGEIPRYWQRVVDALDPRGDAGRDVVAEEHGHVELWSRWRHRLPAGVPSQGLRDVCAELDRLTPSELLGALHAFEIQQPEVAVTKREGLLRWYGCDAADVVYFDEHADEQAHIDYGARLASTTAVRDEFEAGFARGARLFYDGLDRFVAA